MPRYSPVDGCTAAAHSAYFFSDTAIIYPITPSSPMAEYIDAWAAQGRLNAFGQVVRVEEMNSEAAAAGALHGSMTTGALTTTYTASQGLLLMIPNLYKIAGEHLPAVFHVAARTLATHSLSIHGDHSDIMACRQTGAAILLSSDVQEAMDLGIAAHLAALNASHPVIHAFDGFRTSHTIKKVEMVDYEAIRPYVPFDKIEEFRQKALSPKHPETRGSCQGPPVWFQACEADNGIYAGLPEHFDRAFEAVEKITGRKYECFSYIGAPDADRVIVIMGSGAMCVQEAVEYLNKRGEKVGAIVVHLYRPFSAKHFLSKLPETCTHIAVMDRCKEVTATAEPLKLDVIDVLVESGRINKIKVVGGRYALSSKDFVPGDALAIYENLRAATPRDHFTVGIEDDVSHLSLARVPCPSTVPEGTVQCMFYGMGSDGTVGANKNAIKIIADNTPLYAQGYFDYDSFKAGGFTCSHLRFGPKPITSEYYIYDADFTAVSQPSYWNRYSTLLVQHCKEGSILLLNTPATTVEEVNVSMPSAMRAMIVQKKLRVKVMDASAIALAAGLPGRINSCMQAAFFLLSGVLPADEAIEIWKKTVIKTFTRKGEEVVKKNLACVDETIKEGAIKDLVYPENWGEMPDGEISRIYQARVNAMLEKAPAFIRETFMPTCTGKGDSLPVSKFTPNGFMMTGTTKYAKRAIAVTVPVWQSSTCIQCNLCVTACPHAVIRPYLVSAEEEAQLPEDVRADLLEIKNPLVKSKGTYKAIIQASPLDCTGCAVCARVCPTASKGTLKMHVLHEVETAQIARYNALEEHVSDKTGSWTIEEAERGFTYRKPYFEFHGACAGCGETAYITHLTRLFGERMIFANATGCSSIYGFSFPYSPYTTNAEGRGPAWANSLFEDNAEFGFGMLVGMQQRRQKVLEVASRVAKKEECPEGLKTAIEAWVEKFDDIEGSETTGQALQAELAKVSCGCPDITFLKQKSVSDIYGRPIIFIQGGDGWAYDIGFGGLDHVLACGLDVTIMVLDTEVYSNTGGQRSKATPLGAVARFAAAGKRTEKKDLGQIAMSYDNVYVGSIALNANPTHAIQTIRAAVEWKGPSLLLCYAPCIEHGQAMDQSAAAQKLAVETGYWVLYNRHPETGFALKSAAPKKPVEEFLSVQNRFKQLLNERPEEAKVLRAELQDFVTKRYEKYASMVSK